MERVLGMAEAPISELRWGIIGKICTLICGSFSSEPKASRQLNDYSTGCGLVSSWLVGDIILDRPSNPIKHVVQAVGSSSMEKATAFVARHKVSLPPTLYSSYAGVYNDPNVNIVYIGTPHSLHVSNAIDAINAGKHVLCEKPLTINANETRMVIAAAKAKGVYVMEGKSIYHLHLVDFFDAT
jgi:predicted dehydrogenase